MPLVVTLAAYLDDSYEHDSFLYVLGGYLGNVEMWDTRFSPAWQKVIADAPHPIREFKTSDCRQGFNQFSKQNGWNKEERDAITRDVVSVITSVPRKELMGYSSVFWFPTGDMPMTMLGLESDTDRHEMAFCLCLLQVFHTLTRIASRVLRPGDQIQLVLDESPGFVHLVSKYFYKLRNDLPKQIQDIFPYPWFRESHKLEPIQAADLLAYEVFKEAKSRLYEPLRDTSKALERLVASHWNLSEVSTFVHWFNAQLLSKAGIHGENNLTRPYVLFGPGDPWRPPRHFPYCCSEYTGRPHPSGKTEPPSWAL